MASTPCSTSNRGASRKNKPQSGKNNIFNLQQYIDRIINYLLLRSKFPHLTDHQNSSRTSHCKSNRFPISCIHQGVWIFLIVPLQQKKPIEIQLLQELFFPSQTFWSSEFISLQSRVLPFGVRIHQREVSIGTAQPLPASPQILDDVETNKSISIITVEL